MSHSSSERVLVVDDDISVGTVLRALLRQDGHDTSLVPSARDALRALESEPFDVVVTDLRMPNMDGMELLSRIAQRWPEIPVVMITAHGTVPLAVEAMRKGAADFILKPFERENVLYSVRKALMAGRHLSARAATPQAASHESPEHSPMLGESNAMGRLRETLSKVAVGRTTVLLLGETGTGKELAARAIHAQSPRRAEPFVVVNCGALPDTLLESELFGYEKGAFTGAVGRKPGRVELAEGGTLFLDEIGEVPLTMQAKLLRLLQECEYQPLGGAHARKADVRFVAATHRDLHAMAQAGDFREDLYYRLNVLPVVLPPLCERPEDVSVLARAFLARAAADQGRPDLHLSPGALDALEAQPWRGNVRELENAILRLVVLSPGPEIREVDVREHVSPLGATSRDGAAAVERDASMESHRRKAERDAIEVALSRVGNNRTQAARLLGVSRRTLYNKLAELGLS